MYMYIYIIYVYGMILKSERFEPPNPLLSIPNRICLSKFPKALSKSSSLKKQQISLSAAKFCKSSTASPVSLSCIDIHQVTQAVTSLSPIVEGHHSNEFPKRSLFHHPKKRSLKELPGNFIFLLSAFKTVWTCSSRTLQS